MARRPDVTVDLLCGGINAAAAAGAFAVYIMTNPRKRIWIPARPIVRLANFGLALGMTLRSADFFYVAQSPGLIAGHADSATVIGSAMNAIYWDALAWAIVTHPHLPSVWRAVTKQDGRRR